MDQITSVSRPALVTELTKRILNKTKKAANQWIR